MKFRYQAKTKDGEDQVGFVEASDRNTASSILSGHGLFILSLEAADKKNWYERVSGYFSGVKRKDKVIFFRQLATLLEARIPLSAALRSLYEQTANPTLKDAIFEVAEDIDTGLPLSQAMARREGIFSEFYISMVRAAETTGKLDEIVGFLADYTEREDVLTKKTIGAMAYPVFIALTFLVVAFILITFVLPQIKPIFDQSSVELPFLTKILLGSGEFLSKWWPLVIVLIFFGGLLGIDYLHTREGRALVDDMIVKLPIVRKIYLPLIMARLSYTSSLLLRGGIPAAQSLEIVSHIVSNTLYEEVLHEVSEGVRGGETISQSLKRFPDYFPPLVPQMIAVGEESGKLSQIFMRVATFYEREADDVINNIVNLIQPALIVTIGAFVGLLFASILLPLYELTSTFG